MSVETLPQYTFSVKAAAAAEAFTLNVCAAVTGASGREASSPAGYFLTFFLPAFSSVSATLRSVPGKSAKKFSWLSG
jgi:hypothetical protein